jgi:hypothetical protein
MKKLWNRETLRHVDQWACKEGTPEDEEDEDSREGTREEAPGKIVISDNRRAGVEGNVVWSLQSFLFTWVMKRCLEYFRRWDQVSSFVQYGLTISEAFTDGGKAISSTISSNQLYSKIRHVHMLEKRSLGGQRL